MEINDTKKALEIHINRGDCKDCPYAEFRIGACEKEMLKDALRLIVEYEKER